MIDNDMGLLLGKYFLYRSVDTFDLKTWILGLFAFKIPANLWSIGRPC